MPAKKKTARKKAASKKSRKKAAATTKRNRLGVKNSLVNNINARKRKGISRSKKKKTVDKESYEHMEEGWK
jgi:hypothetical protein